MVANRAKGKGTWVETQTVRYARRVGFPESERLALAGANDRGDVRLTTNPLVVVECKYAGGTAGVKLKPWMDELAAEVDNAGAAFGLLVAKQKGYGETRVGEWFAACTMDHFASTLTEVATLRADRYARASNINGCDGFIERCLKGLPYWEPELWDCSGAVGNPVVWGMAMQGGVEVVAGPLWRFLRALRMAGVGEPLLVR